MAHASDSCRYPADLFKVPAAFYDFVREHCKGRVPADLYTHAKKEVMYALWLILLDDQFIEAWREGMVVDCGDGVRRRLFPQIFTYGADYPEK